MMIFIEFSDAIARSFPFQRKTTMTVCRNDCAQRFRMKITVIMASIETVGSKRGIARGFLCSVGGKIVDKYPKKIALTRFQSAFQDIPRQFTSLSRHQNDNHRWIIL